MKKNLFGSLLCIGLVGITLMGARYQNRPPAQTVSQLRISSAGALQSLLDQSGRELIGGGNHAMREGYVFRYQTRQGARLVYAVGKQLSGLTGQKTMQASGVTTTAIANTADGVLEISSEYKLDVKKNQLSIIRRIRNVSTESVKLSLAQNYVDPRLFSEPETNHQLPIKRMFLMQRSFVGNAGSVGFPPGQYGPPSVGWPGDQVGCMGPPNRIWDDFLGNDMGAMIHWGNDECTGCTTKEPCAVCLLKCNCPLCPNYCPEPGSEPGSESLRPQARIYSTRVGRNVYYDAAMSFLPETAVLTLLPPSKSTEESKKSQAHLIIQIQLPAKFK
jgi:hypothetical protein